ncbi:MAG: ECF-type sigma factor [Bacteroidota bacterium]
MDTAHPTALLIDTRGGSPEAVNALFGVVYDELQRLARSKLRAERSNHTLNTSALVHEVYLRLIDQTQLDLRDRARFFALAARCMRFVLVDYARRRSAQKRGGGEHRLTLDEHHAVSAEQPELLLSMDAALERLMARNERMGQVVECRFFAGLTVPETADALGVSKRTVESDWTRAKVYLSRFLEQP